MERGFKSSEFVETLRISFVPKQVRWRDLIPFRKQFYDFSLRITKAPLQCLIIRLQIYDQLNALPVPAVTIDDVTNDLRGMTCTSAKFADFGRNRKFKSINTNRRFTSKRV